MNTGRAPRHWTLYGVASLSARSAASASRVRRSWSSAASLSIENVHSYGYETNGSRSCLSAATHPPSGSTSAECLERLVRASGLHEFAAFASASRADHSRRTRSSRRGPPPSVHAACHRRHGTPDRRGLGTSRRRVRAYWFRWCRAQYRGTASPAASRAVRKRRRWRRRRPGLASRRLPEPGSR